MPSNLYEAMYVSSVSQRSRRCQPLAATVFTLCAVVAALIGWMAPRAAAGRSHYCFGKKATIVGTPDQDRLVGTRRSDVIAGLAGADEIRGRAGRDLLCAGPGGTGSCERCDLELVHGGRGADRISGGSGLDELRGGDGADVVLGRGAADDIYERFRRSGADHLSGGWGPDWIVAGRGDDVVLGGRGVDELLGGEGDDDFRGGRNGRAGFLRGCCRHGNGGDWVEYYGVKGKLHVDLRRGIARGEGTDSLAGIENVIGAESASELLGNQSPNILIGYFGNDLLRGRAGADCLAAWTGRDELHGGGGLDYFSSDTLDLCWVDRSRLIYPGPGGPGDTVDLPRGRVTDSNGNTFLLFGIEGAYGTSGQDKMIGDENANRSRVLRPNYPSV